ncbi:hypothetical protein Fcan01_25532 [Folsomia candida]|uniref:Uncharacterized protein n=1 Tax=Folsomia candida TaxID=158441 RepID=A0A226D4P0_FOLCA|nr:hypothetical protein Fcan01_25532 [Folsomia candida]
MLHKKRKSRGATLIYPIISWMLVNSCLSHHLKITNLDSYINPLSGCVLHLLNYENIEIPNSIRLPFITSRVIVLPYCRVDSNSGFRPKVEEGFPFKTGSNISCLPQGFTPKTKILSIKSQQKGWNRLIRIYLFPPQPITNKRTDGVTSVPDMFEEDFVWNKRAYFDDTTYSRFQYHILVKKPDYPFQKWNVGLNKLIEYNAMIEILVWNTEPGFKQADEFEIVEMLFVCKYCETSFRSFHSGTNYPMSISHIEAQTSYLNTLSSKFPFHVFFLNEQKWVEAGKVKSPKFWEFGTYKLNVAQIVVNLLLDRLNNSNTTTKEIGVRWFFPLDSFGAKCAINFARETNSFCERLESTIPSIVINSESNIKIALRHKVFTFLTSGDRRHGRISMEAILHIYDVYIWLGIFVTGTAIPLMVVLVTRKKFRNGLGDLFMGFAILLEQGTNVQTYGSRRLCMMPLLGPWILMCLIITNAFRGDNVTNVLHPLRAVSIENFGQLVASNSLGYSDMKGVNIPYPSFMMEYDYLLFNYHAYQTSFLSSFISDERHKYLGAKLRLSSIDARGQLLTLTEPLIKGRVFLGWSDKLKETLSMAKSRFPRLVWHMGKEHLARTAYGLEPRHVSNPVLLSRIDGLYQSGITEKWIWYKENSGRVNEYNATDRMESNLVKALNLEENMSDFFIYLGKGCYFVQEVDGVD